jgi:CRISPR-associated exonuclease Cas4
MNQLVFSEDEFLPISALADLLYCERRGALHHLEFMWEDNVFTATGSLLHEHADEYEVEVRGDLRIVRGLRLRSLRLGLTGKADVVEFHRIPEDGTGLLLEGLPGLWQPTPVEYKRGALRKEDGYEVQLCAQAMCLEEMLNVDIPKGAIYYGKTRRRLEITFCDTLRQKTETAAARLHQLMGSHITPKATPGPRSQRCSLNGLCVPRAMASHSRVDSYLKHLLNEA